MHLLGFPKSGNTWACYLLSYALNSAFEDADVAPGIFPREEALRSLVKGGHSWPSHEAQLGPVLKTHYFEHTRSKLNPVVYLVRDPRDVMLSFYAYDTGYLQKQPLLGYGRTRETLHLMKVRLVYGLIKPPRLLYIRQKFPKWLRHVEKSQALGYDALIRFEDLKADTEGTLTRLFSQLGVSVDAGIVRAAVEEFSFSRLKKFEEEKPSDQRFYRKGMSGGWRNVLTAKEIEWIGKRGERVMKALGYQP